LVRVGLSHVPEPYRDLVEGLLEALREILDGGLVSVVVFGSVARGEAREDSDVDLLIVARDLPASRARRVRLFESAEDKIESLLERLHSQGIHCYLSPVILTPEEASRIPALFLDMVEDAVVVYDPGGFFVNLLERLTRRLRELGAERVRLGKKWYWRLKRDYKPGEVIVIE